jgi:hypothetical protein
MSFNDEAQPFDQRRSPRCADVGLESMQPQRIERMVQQSVNASVTRVPAAGVAEPAAGFPYRFGTTQVPMTTSSSPAIPTERFGRGGFRLA